MAYSDDSYIFNVVGNARRLVVGVLRSHGQQVVGVVSLNQQHLL